MNKVTIPFKIARLLLAVIFIMLLGGCASVEIKSQPVDMSESLKIGFIGPLTGSQAPFGQSQLEAVKMLVEETDKGGGIDGRLVDLIPEDSKGAPADAVTAAHKLIDVDHVIAIIGDMQSGDTMAIAPIVEQAKIPLVTPIATSPAISNAGDFVFRTMPSTQTQVELLANIFASQGIKRVGVIYVDNEFGKRSYEAFKGLFGGEIVLAEAHKQDESDFRSSLSKVQSKIQSSDIQSSDVQILVLMSYPKESGLLMRQLRELNLTIPVYGIETLGHIVTQKTAGLALEGAYYAYPRTDTNSAFKDQFVKRFSHDPEFGTDTAYDAASLILESIHECGIEPVEIKNCLYKVGKDYQGVSGNITFDQNGDVHRPAVLYQFRNVTAVKIEGLG